MRYFVFVIILVLFLALGANAQTSQLVPSYVVAGADAVEIPNSFASATLVPAENLPAGLAGGGSSSAAPRPQGDVISATIRFGYQAYLGYTFVRVYAFPGRQVNRN